MSSPDNILPGGFLNMVHGEEESSIWLRTLEILRMLVIILPLFYLLKGAVKVQLKRYYQFKIEKKNILYVIAHPDDESMFFAPSILSLTQHNNIYLICLSNGNAAGLGRIREKELTTACKYLGIYPPEILDAPALPDSMTTLWSAQVVSDHVQKYLTQLKKDGKQIDIIFSFDEQGVSGHPNHTACYKGVLSLLLTQSWPQM